MKYQFESTEGEFIAFLDTVKSLAQLVAKTSLKREKLRRKSVEESVLDADDALRDVEEAELDADSDDALPSNVTHFRVMEPPPAPVAKVDEAAERAAEEQRVKVLHGKDQWIALVDVWRTNFGIEGAEQPDRVRNLMGALNPFVNAYLHSRAGLTEASREAIYLLDGGDPEATTPPRYGLTNRQLREARLIAENIAQVASFHAPWLAEQLEYAYEFHTLPKED